jgi:hypothetical protein
MRTFIGVFLAIVLAAVFVLPDFRHSVLGYPQDDMNTDFRAAVHKIPHNVSAMVTEDSKQNLLAAYRRCALLREIKRTAALINEETARIKAERLAECNADRIWPPCK